MIRRLLKNTFLVIVVVFILYLVVTNISFFRDLVKSKNHSFIIDADTGNEQDELFAIVRAIIEPDTKIIGLCSSHWQTGQETAENTVGISQELNEKILSLMYLTDIPHPPGAAGRIYTFPDTVPQESPAALFIIGEARKLRSDEKLQVVTLGTMTNLASAILIAPDIIPKLECHVMGLKYNARTRVWNKNEYNTRNDLDAVDILLDAEGLDLHIMTATTSGSLVFRKEPTLKKLDGSGGVWDLLVRRWKEKYPEHDEWTMGDVALVEAIFHPALATQKKVITPPENRQRKVWVYTDISAEDMEKDFFKAVEKYIDTY